MTQKELGRALDLIDRLADEYSPEKTVAKFCRMQHEAVLWARSRLRGLNIDFTPELDAVLALWPDDETTNAE